jgi:hypothetical protein
MTSLNISTNGIGEYVLPEGWSKVDCSRPSNVQKYQHSDGRELEGELPEGAST